MAIDEDTLLSSRREGRNILEAYVIEVPKLGNAISRNITITFN
jgi:hypothetical protein